MSQLLINQYLNDLATLKRVSGAQRESVVREAFKDLLKAWGRSHSLTFIPEHEFISTAKVRNYVDGALMHDLRVPFGYWEAKDADDDLDAEIQKKFRRGYPQTNIIFEDSQRAILIQDGLEVIRCDVTDGPALQNLLELFFGYQRPEIAEFRKAIIQFKADLPAVLQALRERIDEAFASNEDFKTAATEFLKTARETINPGIGADDIREMLIQHILTEDIFARVFGQDDFHRENNVAKALYGLEHRFFRGEVKQATLRALEPYYAAIRSTAALISSHSEKQGFLKAIYENFYKVYNPAAADRLGVVYTPNEIVRFMVESADWLCEKHFGKNLIDRDVEILDPATGTGTFIVELLEHFRGQPEKLKWKYREELHANEVAILPYYVANLNIEATYATLAGVYEEFPGLCFVDTLDNVAGLGIFSGHQFDLLGGISDENVERVKRQNRRKISVVIGNPPYNANQQNENDDNKNRTYQDVDRRIKNTYIKQSTAQKTKLYDMYSRFFRWASDRISDDGMVVFITNRSFIEGRAFDGFRRSLEREFSDIYVLDLGGDIRANPKLSGTKHNVFGIQTGVAISFLVRKKGQQGARIQYGRRPEFDLAEEKLRSLSNGKLSDLCHELVRPDNKGNWIGHVENDFDDLLSLADKKTKSAKISRQEKSIFKLFSLGVVTARDEWVYGRDESSVSNKVSELISVYNSDRTRINNNKVPGRLEDKLTYSIKWSRAVKADLDADKEYNFNEKNIVYSLYRPFSGRKLYFSNSLNEMQYQLPKIFPAGDPGPVILISGAPATKSFQALATKFVPSYDTLEKTQCLARYRYASGRRLDNITDWAVSQFAKRYGAKAKIGKDDIFAYVYGVLHDPIYRDRYSINLRREFPRVPLYGDFSRWRDWGEVLLNLHMNYEDVAPWSLERVDTPDHRAEGTGTHPTVKLRSDRENGIIELDSETRLSGVPDAAWDYRLGNRSAIDWVLDQHKEKTPKDPTIREKFNTYRFADHKEAVVELLRRVTTVSVRTMEIVEAMRALKR